MVRQLILNVCYAVLSFVPASYAKDFGSHGPVWEISEPNLMATINARLAEMQASGEAAKIKAEMQERTRSYIDRPRPVVGLTKARERRSFDVDLSVTVDRDLTDHRGVVFASVWHPY